MARGFLTVLSHSRLSLRVSPSRRPLVLFSIPPVVVAVRPVDIASSDPLQQLGARAVLRNDESGKSSSVHLTENSSASVRSRTGIPQAGCAAFDRLSIKISIKRPGRYKLRVMLVLETASGVSVQGFIDSGFIHVHSDAVRRNLRVGNQVHNTATRASIGSHGIMFSGYN
ncbi:hypothetical protein BDW66DRAFT_142111, partial [Aspergillus desertorum]